MSFALRIVKPIPSRGVGTRRYEQRIRAQTAEDTRRRILDAVYERLRESPSEPVSVDRIARMAGVARSTVYLVFGSRAGLFDALARDLMDRAGYAELIEAVRHPDAREHMRGGIAAGARIFASQRDVLRALYSMALLDEEAVGDAIRRSEAERSRGMQRLARLLGEQELLREGVTVADATHLLWVLTSFDAFDLLYTGRNLPLDDVIRLLVEGAERAVLRI
jgi:AcrR family transcriptional regulator